MRAQLAAAALLVSAAWWWRRQGAAELAAGGVATIETGNEDQAGYQGATMLESVEAGVLATVNTLSGSDAAGMSTSPAGLAHMQQFEGLRLTRYRLGDGGWTIGFGRYYPDGGQLPPEQIDRATADAWFLQDVQERGERWVKAYVTAPLTQPQFDALVSMAYNLSPRSFRTIADAVNAGEDPEAAALRFVRAGTGLERGLRRRRSAELAMYRADPTTYG